MGSTPDEIVTLPDGIITLAELHNPGFHVCEKMTAARHARPRCAGTASVLRIDLKEDRGKVVATPFRFSADGLEHNVTKCDFCGQNFDVTFRR